MGMPCAISLFSRLALLDRHHIQYDPHKLGVTSKRRVLGSAEQMRLTRR